MVCLLFAVVNTESLSVFEQLDTFMARGGFLMWPLLLCSIVAVATILRKIIYYTHYRLMIYAGVKDFDQALLFMSQGKYEEAKTLAATNESPFAHLLHAALHERMVGFDQALEEEALFVTYKMRKQLSILDTIVTVAPMIGILGTVTGIIGSFDLLGSMGVDEPTAVTGGIAEALLTTAAGLFVSILALLPLNWFRSLNRQYVRELEGVSHRITVAHTKVIHEVK